MEDSKEYIDLRKVFKRIKENKWKFIIILPIVGVISALLSLQLPRYYVTEVKVVPEMENSGGLGGTLGDMASMIGLDLNNMQTSDAITPLLYPDLLEDNGFVASLFDIRVKSNFDLETPIDTTFYTYMKKYQKSPIWKKKFSQFKKKFLPKPKKFEGAKSADGEFDPYCVSEDDDNVMESIRGAISINIDKKTAVISIGVQTQDPFICRQIADTIKGRLQNFITEYRTSKARVDMEYYRGLMEDAKIKYDESRTKYLESADANMDIILESVRAEVEEMENDMQNKYNYYTTMVTQYQAAAAKLQSRTPVFTTLKEAVVPVKHAGPKRMMIVIATMFLTMIVLIMWVIRKDIASLMKE